MFKWVAALFALALLGQEDNGEQFYKFKKDTAWTFDRTEGDKKLRIELKVLKEEDGKIHVESNEFRGEDKEPRVEKLVWYVENGLLTWGEIKEGKLNPVFQFYKLGSKKGDTWKISLVGDGVEGEATHLGVEEVKVPAGTYKEVVHVQVKIQVNEIQIKTDLYFAPKVGMIKLSVGDGGQTNVMELRDFKEAK